MQAVPLKSLMSVKDHQDVPLIPTSLDGYLINTPGCRIPDLDPFDLSVRKFIDVQKPQICNSGIPPLFNSNFSSIYIIDDSKHFYNIRNTTELNCCYQELVRRVPKDDENDNKITYNDNCTKINDGISDIDSEFIKVKCNVKGKQIYEDYFSFVPYKNKNVSITSNETLKPNILIIGLDAVSRINLRRQMPKSYSYLTQDLDAIDLLGYNKVADNTFPNLIPVLTGLFESELVDTCWPNSSSRFDSCPFIWKNFSSQQNYVTSIGEDCAGIGTFYYQKRGFKVQTSDYYVTSFLREIDDEIGSDKDFNCKQCMGARHSYTILLEYIGKFVQRMKMNSTPYFGFFWGNTLSHDYLNRPSLGDETFHDLFKNLNDNGYLDNTIMIFMSDHGIRWGSIRQTYQGQMEERLPFVVMTLPKWFKKRYPNAVMNIRKNVRRLTTPFDLHETLKDLVNVENLSFDPEWSNQDNPRGYSLFKSIPKERTCTDAAIDDHWCTCQQSIEVPTNNTEVISVAEYAVFHMNSQLIGYKECATLELIDIINARLLSHDKEHITHERSMKDYTVTLKTVPGDGVFEVTVRIWDQESTVPANFNRTMTVPEKWKYFSVAGTISRLNLYGKQSACISDFHLKLYCYCQSILKLL